MSSYCPLVTSNPGQPCLSWDPGVSRRCNSRGYLLCRFFDRLPHLLLVWLHWPSLRSNRLPPVSRARASVFSCSDGKCKHIRVVQGMFLPTCKFQGLSANCRCDISRCVHSTNSIHSQSATFYSFFAAFLFMCYFQSRGLKEAKE